MLPSRTDDLITAAAVCRWHLLLPEFLPPLLRQLTKLLINAPCVRDGANDMHMLMGPCVIATCPAGFFKKRL